MSISISHPDQNTLKMAIDGTFGSIIHKEFRIAYEERSVKNYILDLEQTKYIDSAGLGMLLLLKDHAGGDHANIELINCSEQILDIFRVTCFYRLFNIPQCKKKHT